MGNRASGRAAPGPDAAPKLPSGRLVGRVMTRLGRAIRRLELPAVEKISEDETSDAFHVLISTMLSAQTRDAVTLEASTRLFRAARSPRRMAKLPVSEIQRLIYPVSFYRHKARHVRETCELLMSRFGGRVPGTMDELLSLPGVGRKTANLVLILAHRSSDNICVDTHVHRISKRLGWVATRTPEQTEQALYRTVARRWWRFVNLYFVTWGQNVCRPVYPLCPACAIAADCGKVGVGRIGRVPGIRAGTAAGEAQAAAPAPSAHDGPQPARVSKQARPGPL